LDYNPTSPFSGGEEYEMEGAKVAVRMLVDPPGVIDVGPRPNPHLVIHVGTPVPIGCERAGEKHRGTRIHGDVDIVPAGVTSRWVLEKQDRALVVSISQDLLGAVASEMGLDPKQAILFNRFQVRDARLEHLAWALKTEMDDDFRNGPLFRESIGIAIACQLMQSHSAATEGRVQKNGSGSGFRLRKVLSYIEENLGEDLSLETLAAIGGLSVSHSQRAFRDTVGISVHQYVIQRRVERAKSLLSDQNLSIREVALVAGFSHQSHMAYHLRRLYGCSPMEIRRENG
jgi:AraC family transcriptional regulator